MSEANTTTTEARVSLPEGLVNATLQYLTKRPYEEVFQLVALIQHTASKVEPVAPAPAADADADKAEADKAPEAAKPKGKAA